MVSGVTAMSQGSIVEQLLAPSIGGGQAIPDRAWLPNRAAAVVCCERTNTRVEDIVQMLRQISSSGYS
jgi:hypothetical protein